MWKVFRDSAEVAQAQEAFGSICVSAAVAKELFGPKAILESDGRPSVGDLGEGPLFGLANLADLNGVKGCSVDRGERTYTLPAAPAPTNEAES